MRKYSMMTLLVISLFFAAPAFAGMKVLNDQQLDMVTAGSNNVVNRSQGSVVGDRGIVDNSIRIDQSVHVLEIRNSEVDIRSLLTTVGDGNTTVTGLNALVGIDRSPGSPRSSSTPNLGSSPITQVNRIGYP